LNLTIKCQNLKLNNPGGLKSGLRLKTLHVGVLETTNVSDEGALDGGWSTFQGLQDAPIIFFGLFLQVVQIILN
jgi:hypothetical protein